MSVQERFLKYVSFDTQSDESSQTAPSTLKQLKLAEELKKECEELGFDSVILDPTGTVYAILEARGSEKTPIGFIAHMDTATELSGADVRPRIIQNYDGGTIVLNEEYSMSPEEFPVLSRVVGEDLIVTDGTTLLGADDKAGIAIIMQSMENLIASGREHGTIAVAFTPDEEIGRGVDHFDLEKFPVEYAYTVDGGDINGIDYETFNAAQAVVEFHGRSIHPGDAKDKMINACLLAMEYNALLPAQETPAHTSGRQGFFHLCTMEGNVDHARLVYIIRDHDRDLFENRKRVMEQAAASMNEKTPHSVSVQIRDQYYNMKDYMNGDMRAVHRAQKAMEALGIEPKSTPVRGGTDGAMLTARGLICPNLGTGGANCHGRYEFASINRMEKMTDLLAQIIEGE